MTSYGASIQLTDNMTSVLNSVITAVNMTISTVESMQSSVDGFDASGFGVIHDAMAQAQVAVDAFHEKMQEPVKVPEPEITWTSSNFEVFTNTGADRFVSESQSALHYMNQLIAKQNEIAQLAANADIFPENAVKDLGSIGDRLSIIQNKMQLIESNPANPLDPHALNELESLRHQLTQALTYQEQMNTAVKDLDVSRVNQLYHQLNNIVNQTEQEIRDNVNAQGQFNSSIDEGVAASGNLKDAISRVASAFGLYKIADVLKDSTQELISLSDDMTGYEARLMLNVDEGSIDEVKAKIYNAAQDSRADYADMMATVSKLGVLAGDSFSDSLGNVNYEQIIDFQELMNKNFVVGGASAEEQAAAMYQLTQAMASGKLQGDEYRSITENAPLLNQAIEDYMTNIVGVEGTMKEWAADGLLTADVIKNAVFSSANEINAKFETIPMTWGQVGTQLKNEAVVMFEPVLEKINELANNDEFLNVLNNVKSALGVVVNFAMSSIDMIANGAIWISDNWSIISPVIYGIVAALSAYAVYLGITKAIEFASAAGKIIMCMASYAHAAAAKTEASATAQATAAQYGFNTALLASPVTWIIIALIALVAIIFVVINAINKATGSSISAIGVIFGALCWFGALVVNMVIGLINSIIQFLWFLFVEPFIWIIEWILNVCMGGFDSFGGAVANLIGNILSWFLSLGKVVTTIIDAIFGTDWTGGLTSLQDTVLAWGQTDDTITISKEAYQINRLDLTDAYDWGYSKGEALNESISGIFAIDTLTDYETLTGENETDYAAYLTSIEDIAENTANTTSGIKDSIDEISDDQLEWLRKIADRDTINRFTTAEIKLDFTSSATLNSDMDIDGYINTFTRELQETLVSTAEGLEE